MTKRKAIIFALLFATAAGICATDSGKKVYIADTGNAAQRCRLTNTLYCITVVIQRRI